jgi:peptidoglycan/LPS O-acetylase OafA/YrhL
MSLPTSQRRALNQIEKTLADDHPSLGPLFAVFTRLTGHQAMPVTEQVTARRWRWRWQRMRPGVVTVVGLAMATGALLTLSLMLPGPQLCAPGTATLVAAHARSAPTGRQPACATQQNKPTNTTQSGLSAR